MKWVYGLVAMAISALVLYSQHPGMIMNPLHTVEAATVVVGDSTPYGSGFLVGRDLVVTVKHVVDALAGRPLVVLLKDGTTVEGHPLALSETNDLALLKLEKPVRIHPLKVNCERPRAGDKVALTGHPLTRKWVTTWGHVASDNLYDELLLVDLPLNPGNSGGPAWNSDGQVVGVADAYLVLPVGSFFSLPTNSGIGAIVPGDKLCEFLGDRNN